MLSTRQKGFSKLFVVLVILFLLVTLAVSYFLLWRPTDKNIEDALSNVSILQKTGAVIMPSAYKVLTKPRTITPEAAAIFKSDIVAYASALTSLEKSVALTHSVSASAVYGTYKSTLTKYGETLIALATSVSTYGQTLAWCNAMEGNLKSVHSKSDFDKVSADCNNALNNATNSPDTNFNDQFFTNYKVKAKALLKAMGDYYAASDSSKAATQNALIKANAGFEKAASATVNYGYPAPSSDIFTKLTQTLNTEKSSFIR